MTSAKAWKALGIAKTDDARSIKRAYAAKLKAIDPDKDPNAFLSLRNAYEIAMREAEWGALDSEELEEQDEEREAGELNPSDMPPGDDLSILAASDAPREAEADNSASPSDDPRARLGALLSEEAPGPDHPARIEHALQEVLQSPRMLEIDFARETEDWLCWILTETIPNSDPAILIANRYFGWEDSAQRVGGPWQVGFLAERSADIATIQRLEKPDHRWHGAWKLLTSDQAEPGFAERLRFKRSVTELLGSIRYHNPRLEGLFNPAQLEFWAKRQPKIERGESRSWPFILLVIVFINVARVFSPGSSADPPAPTVYQDPSYYQWRSEQAPEVQSWMDAHRDKVQELFAHQATKEGGFPSCAALDATAPLSLSDYDTCLEAEIRRTQVKPPELVDVTPMRQTASSHMVYSSPLWRSEQAPRIQKWMDSQPEALNSLLQPHVNKGGLPSCAKLNIAVAMTADEYAQCRRAEQSRLASRHVQPPGEADQALAPREPRATPETPDRSVPPSCSDPMFAYLELCKPKGQTVSTSSSAEN